ncbi:MAG: invasion associated locus B family protein [Candidatus Phaeomarinobacter sp.]
MIRNTIRSTIRNTARRMGQRILAQVAAGAGLLLALSATGAHAQTSEGGAVQPTVVEQHGMWVFECTPTNGSEFCTMQQVLSNADTQEVLLHVTIAYHPRSADLLMVSRTPLGVELPLGIGMQVDEGQQMAAPYTNCTEAGCRATAPLSPELVNMLKNGNTMKISFGYRGQRIDAPVSLTGFTAAYSAISARKPVATAPSLAPTPAQ